MKTVARFGLPVSLDKVEQNESVWYQRITIVGYDCYAEAQVVDHMIPAQKIKGQVCLISLLLEANPPHHPACRSDLQVYILRPDR